MWHHQFDLRRLRQNYDRKGNPIADKRPVVVVNVQCNCGKCDQQPAKEK